MRFVILTQYYPPEVGAPQVRLASFARELGRRGHSVQVVTALPNYPTGRIFDGYRRRLWVREAQAGVPVLRTWLMPSQSARLMPRMGSYLSFCLSSLCSAGALGRPDFIFVESPPLFLGLTGAMLARLTGARWMMNVSDVWPDSVAQLGMVRPGRLLKLASRLEASLYRSADFVVAVTEGIGDLLRTKKGVADRKVLFLPNGVDLELFQPRPRPDAALLAEHGLEGKAIFLFAGTHGHAQDLPGIVEAATLLRDDPTIAIVFVGDGPVKQDVEAEVERRGLRNVTFIGPQPVERMPAYWSIARAALVTLRDLPLFDGARPSKSLPALASGVPIVYAGRGEWAGILERAGAGVIVPPGRPEALTQAMRALAADAPAAARLGAQARRLAEERFSWPAIVGTWLDDLASRERSEPRAP
jgi:glycosyltransferase involved in cell wall biosynthesis